jgi:hypothetical protein
MYNSRTTNAHQDSIEADSADDSADNSAEDLDVMLRAEPNSSGTSKQVTAEVDAESCTLLAALQLRTSYITESLTTALDSVCELQDLVDKDRLTAGRFVAEMHHWNRVMGQLELYTQSHPNNPDANSDVAAPGEEQDARVEELLQALKTQEDKIQALESRLDGEDTPSVKPRVNRLLVITMGDRNLKYPLTTSIVSIGRGKKNDIQLDSSHASRHHCRILNDDHGAYIEDLKSANGVMVNSQRVERQKLSSGDIIIAGRVQIKYIDLMEGSSGEGEA